MRGDCSKSAAAHFDFAGTSANWSFLHSFALSLLPFLRVLCVLSGECGSLLSLAASQKIGEQLVSFLCQDRFGMELHPFHRPVPVPDTHDLAVVGPRGDFETGGQAFLFDDQRMIARGSQRVG